MYWLILNFSQGVSKNKLLSALYGCTGRYEFKGWELEHDGIQIINENKILKVTSPASWPVNEEMNYIRLDCDESLGKHELKDMGHKIRDYFIYNGIDCESSLVNGGK